MAHAAKRVALVIGNSAYSHASSLKNPKNDADAIADRLERLGFKVVKGTDLTYPGMRRTLHQFAYELQDAEVSLLFYAGHGLQVNGSNFLVPVDAKLANELDLEFEAMKLSTILSQMERSTKTTLVFLDACRDNPLARNLARNMGTRSTLIGQGLARVETGVGTMIVFATQPGNVALDGEGKHSPFTEALLKHVETPGLDVALVMRRVRQDVIGSTKGAQVPWDNSSLTGTFVFKHVEKAPKVASKQPATPMLPAFDRAAIDLAFWQSVKETDTREAYETYLERFPKGAFVPVAKLKINEIEQRETAEAEKVAQQAETQKKQAEALAAKRNTDAEKRRRELAELRRKHEEEQQRLARERDDLQKRLAEAEERAKRAAELQKAQEEKTEKVASLQPGTDPSAKPQATREPTPYELALALQTELKRVGCDPGQLDGQWGAKGRGAMTRFNTYAKLTIPVGDPSLQAIEAVKRKNLRVCPAAVQPVRTQRVKKHIAPAKTVTALPKVQAAPKRRGPECLDNPGIASMCSRGTSDPSRSGLGRN